MTIKTTQSGKISMKLHWQERISLYRAICSYLENLPATSGTIGAGLNTSLFYCTINEIIADKDFHPLSGDVEKLSVSRAQAIALIGLLKNHDDNPVLLEIKSALHKILS